MCGWRLVGQRAATNPIRLPTWPPIGNATRRCSHRRRCPGSRSAGVMPGPQNGAEPCDVSNLSTHSSLRSRGGLPTFDRLCAEKARAAILDTRIGRAVTFMACRRKSGVVITALRPIVIQYEHSQAGRQIAPVASTVKTLDEIRYARCAPRRYVLQSLPEGLFQADARSAPLNHNRSFDDAWVHRPSSA